MSTKEPRRARRIRHTRRISARRRSDYLRYIHDDPTGADVDCIGELADTWSSTIKGIGCTCRSRRRGRPKVAGGLCRIGQRDRIYLNRRQARRLTNMSRRSGVNWELDDMVLLSLPYTNKGVW